MLDEDRGGAFVGRSFVNEVDSKPPPPGAVKWDNRLRPASADRQS